MPSLDPESRSLLAEARQLHVGIVTSRGPHVTPELYATVADDIWFATAASTLKARALSDDPRIAATVRVGSRAVVAAGEARLYDATNPRHFPGIARDAQAALQAVGAFTLRNAADLGGFARDLVTGKLPSRMPPRRVLVRLRPELVDVVDVSGLPGARDAVIGLALGGAPLVTAGRCDDAVDVAWLPAEIPGIALHDGDHTPACIAVDDYRAPGPAAKQGRLRRGSATISADGGVLRLTLDAEHDTTWDGVIAQTRPAS